MDDNNWAFNRTGLLILSFRPMHNTVFLISLFRPMHNTGLFKLIIASDAQYRTFNLIISSDAQYRAFNLIKTAKRNDKVTVANNAAMISEIISRGDTLICDGKSGTRASLRKTEPCQNNNNTHENIGNKLR